MALGPENARARHNQQTLIEKSSLGTDTARALRESVSAEHGHRIAEETKPSRGPWVHKNGEICVYAPQCAAPYVVGQFDDNAFFVRHAGELRLPEGFTPLATTSPAAEELPAGPFDIDAAVERVSEAVRAAFVDMQRWGLLGSTSAAESWPTWNEVPDGIWFTRNGLGPIVANRKRGAVVDCRRRDGSTIVMPIPASFAGNPHGPFVPVEVDL